MIRILIGGDIYPAGRIQSAFIKGRAFEIFHDLLEEITRADLSIANLECPLVSKETPIDKAGPVLGANSLCIKGLSTATWKILNLANNHSFDHGAEGLRETMHTIRAEGLSVVGAGMNIREAQIPLVEEIDGQRIVIYAMAEREFSTADRNTPGANPLDLISFVNAIRLYKQQGLFIVLLHGGKEYYAYPSPEMIRRCRFMIEMGADAVVCCHTHGPLPWEVHAERPIIYGLGNLIFESDSEEPDPWYEGYMAKLTIENGQIRFDPIPYVQSKKMPGVCGMDHATRERFLEDIQVRGSRLKDGAFIEDQWGGYCRGQRIPYLTGLFGYNRFMRKLRKLLLRTIHSHKDILQALHLVKCETHQEVLSEILDQERRSS
jgi:poly-gamma-glutamate synthesis protein (capsule biosynthesis protein)